MYGCGTYGTWLTVAVRMHYSQADTAEVWDVLGFTCAV